MMRMLKYLLEKEFNQTGPLPAPYHFPVAGHTTGGPSFCR